MSKKSILLSGIFATALFFNSCKKEQIENEEYSLCGMVDGWPKRNCYSIVEFTLLDRTLIP